MEVVRIFLASSMDLQEDRKAFEVFLYRKSKLWKDQKNIFLELKNWEDFVDAVSKTRLQDEYNNAIRESDIFVMLFWTKAGMYTCEEFEIANMQFQRIGKPLIYVYFKDAQHHAPCEDSLEFFSKKLKDLGHFQTVFKNTEGLLLHFSSQLDKLYSRPQISIRPTKDQIMSLINKGDLFESFEELNKFFLGNNDSLNALLSEYINPPNNFNPAQFSTRLKLFISRNWQFIDEG